MPHCWVCCTPYRFRRSAGHCPALLERRNVRIGNKWYGFNWMQAVYQHGEKTMVMMMMMMEIA